MFNMFNKSNIGKGLPGFLQGIFGDSGAPYQKFMDQYQKYMGQAQEAQNPFYNAGTGALGNYQDWLSGQKDPAGFVNNLMSQYKESPWAKYLTKQGQRGINNAASASGMLGSSPLLQEQAANAENIASGDMQSWLGNVIGINTQYGQGEKGLVDTGQHSADQISQIMEMLAQGMGGGAFGAQYGKQQDRNAGISGFLKMIGLG